VAEFAARRAHGDALAEVASGDALGCVHDAGDGAQSA
jgi:hypothetical protein